MLDGVANWLANSAVGSTIAGSAWLFPTIETLHVIFLSIVVGSIATFDLRLLGVRFTDRPFSALYREVLPLVWGCYILAAICGNLLLSANAERYLHNTQFQFKFLLMALAGLNMLVFHLGVFRKISLWDRAVPPPLSARIAGALSMLLWIGVVVMGRWVGFAMS